jgi:Flp pilus assembly protein TadD
MKQIITFFISLFIVAFTFAQPGKKQKPPSQTDINKMMDDATKGMSPEEQAEMKKSLGGVMNDMMKQPQTMANYPEFTDNKALIPKRDAARINALPKKKLLQADMGGYAGNLYNKIMTKGDAAEIAIVKKVIAQTPAANDIGSAAILCMMQGHPQAAMALSMKAVQADPTNMNAQNNMASLLTDYGYPEQAIPVLQKLITQFPSNSTVVNNLGQAWLALGEVDSAGNYIRKAGGLNPYHPEAKESEGIIEETTGNTEKATDDYVQAMENAVSPFTAQLLKNSGAQAKLDNLTLDDIKRSLTSYTYFSGDWLPIPKLSNSVTGYSGDRQTQISYENMYAGLEKKIEDLIEAASTIKDGTAEEMARKTRSLANGFTIMSKKALIVTGILEAYYAKWMTEYLQEHIELLKKIDDKREEMTKCNGCKCSANDAKWNAYMEYINPVIRDFYFQKVLEFQILLNTYCTWIWYVNGNANNEAIQKCLALTAVYAGLFNGGLSEQQVHWQACKDASEPADVLIDEPKIPNFSCPAVVPIPSGKDLQRLSNAAKNLNGNQYNIPQAVANAVPNGSGAMGLDPNIINEAGKAPSTKTANGSTSPENTNDEELTPMQTDKQMEKYKQLRELFKKLMEGKCKEDEKGYKEKLLEELRKKGIHSSLSSGVQAPGTFTPKPGLFK